jgi:hypothetical protein
VRFSPRWVLCCEAVVYCGRILTFRGVHAAFIYRVKWLELGVPYLCQFFPSPVTSSWRWRQHSPLKQRCPATTLHDVTSQYNLNLHRCLISRSVFVCAPHSFVILLEVLMGLRFQHCHPYEVKIPVFCHWDVMWLVLCFLSTTVTTASHSLFTWTKVYTLIIIIIIIIII